MQRHHVGDTDGCQPRRPAARGPVTVTNHIQPPFKRGPPLPGRAGGPRRPQGLDRSGGVAKGKRRPPGQSALQVTRQLAHTTPTNSQRWLERNHQMGPPDHGRPHHRALDHTSAAAGVTRVHPLPPPAARPVAPHAQKCATQASLWGDEQPTDHPLSEQQHGCCRDQVDCRLTGGPCVSFGGGSFPASHICMGASSERALCGEMAVGAGEFTNEGPRCVAESSRRCVCSRSAAAGPARVPLRKDAVPPPSTDEVGATAQGHPRPGPPPLPPPPRLNSSRHHQAHARSETTTTRWRRRR